MTIDFGIPMIFGDELKADMNNEGRRLVERLLEVKVVPGWAPDEEGYDKVLDFKWQLVEAEEK